MEQYQKEKGGARVQNQFCDRQVVTELSADITLPDYRPEIKRLLRIHTTVMPADKYIGPGNADISGIIHYTVLYAGNDGQIYSVSSEGEYRFAVPVEVPHDCEISEGILCRVEGRAESCSGRVGGPRRLTVKCRLRSRVQMYGMTLLEEKTDCPKESTERLWGSAECARIFLGESEAISLGDEILFENPAEELRVIGGEGNVQVSEAVAGSGEVHCRGEVVLKLLCARGDAPDAVQSMWRRIPFSQSVPVDGVEVNCAGAATGTVKDLHFSVEEGRILCEVNLILSAYAHRNESITYTKDLYSTAVKCESKYRECSFTKALMVGGGNFSLNQTMPMAEIGIKPEGQLLDIVALPAVTSVESERGKIYVIGKCRFHALVLSGEEMGGHEFELPFRYECEGNGSEIGYWNADVTPISVRARVDGERIAVDAELSVCVTACQKTQFVMLSEATAGDEIVQNAAIYTVCYPQKGDTVWSVAKRYHRSVSSICNMNHFSGDRAADSPESLAGVEFLLA